MSSIATKIGFSLIPALAVWLIAEAAVSMVFSEELAAWEAPPAQAEGQTPTMPGNPYLLYEYRPGRHIQAGATVTINSLGLRGEEPAIPPPPNTRRLMTTGDSSIFGFGVEDDEVFSEVAAAQLGEGVDAINAATPGYSTFQTINLLRLRAMKTDPDLLVIGNLWSDNNFDAFVDRDLLAEYAGFESSTTGRIRQLLARSALFRLMDFKLRVEPAELRVRTDSWMQTGDPSLLDQGEHIGLRRVEINDYAANLDTLYRIAADHGAEVLFLLPANNEDLDSTPLQRKAWDP